MYKNIKNYSNYLIYDNGDVYNIMTKKLLKGSIGEHGYKYYRLSKDGVKKMFYAHRLVAEAFLDNPDNLNIVNHKDGNKQNNNVNNLEWVNQSENVKHAHELGLIHERKESEYYIEDFENEVWLSLFDLPYLISNYGRVRNTRTNLILKPSITCGYYKVRPSVEGRPRDIMIHKAVYQVFNHLDDIPKGYVVDHLDGNKLNNNVTNLRLITLSENAYSALYLTKTNSNHKEVEQYDLHGNYLNTFNSAREAARVLNLDSSTISKVCRGKNKTHGGYVFKYK